MSERMKPNQIRHQQNLTGRHGLDGQFYKGIYYRRGVAQESKAKQEARLERRRAAFEPPLPGWEVVLFQNNVPLEQPIIQPMPHKKNGR